jgi:acyl carrier protein
MELNEFIKTFEAQLEDIEPGTVTGSTRFRELEEWDSMTALVIIAMADREYGKLVTGDELKNAETVEQLFNTISNK